MFESKTLAEHLARGALGIAALAAALALAPSRPLALALVPVALVALRGCPMCWTIGLAQTVVARLRGRNAPDACVDGGCALVRPPAHRGAAGPRDRSVAPDEAANLSRKA